MKRKTCVYQLYYHVILTVKYRKKILNQYVSDIKETISELSTNSCFNVEKVESDQDHIHILISAEPRMSPARLIRMIKQQTTYELWHKHEADLKREFYKKHTFWSPSYFVNSIGSVSKEAIERYIANQGKKHNSTRKLKHTRHLAH